MFHLKTSYLFLLQRLILLSAKVRRGWWGRSRSSRLWWRSCKGVCESRWWILNETSNASCCRLSIWRKKEIVLLVFVCTPNLDHKLHTEKCISNIWSTKSENINIYELLRLTSELFNISRTLVQWAPSVANACRTWFSMQV
jgi:hypothetical protein